MTNIKSIRDENRQLSQNLKKENQEIYTDLVCYLRVSNLSDMEQEEIISDLLRMFFDWEKQGKAVNEMIGEDYKQFADDIIAAVNPQKSILKKSKEYFVIIFNALCYLLTIDFAFLYLPKIVKGDLSFVYNYSLSMALRGILLFVAAICIVTYIGKNSFSLSYISKPARFLIGCCAAGFIVISVFITRIFSDEILVSINISYIIAIVAVFWLYKGIQRFALSKNPRTK
ncbi:hypothetical protein [Anaerocolumna jejuensis]|uniref:hypothetical protein n=1 Tax=Anaerocolumna jejuensis TaxID=259063 RepID=UPI003F7CD187